MHKKIIFYRFLRMGKVILCSFSLSPYIIFIPAFCFAQIPKNPPPTEEESPSYSKSLGPLYLMKAVSSTTVRCSAGCCGQATYAIICKCLQSLYPHKRGSSFPSQGSVVPEHAGCLGLLQTALSTPHSPGPWIIYSYVCTLWCPSLPSEEPAGRQHGSGRAIYNILGLIAIWGESWEWMHGMYLKRSPRRKLQFSRGDSWVLRLPPMTSLWDTVVTFPK